MGGLTSMKGAVGNAVLLAFFAGFIFLGGCQTEEEPDPGTQGGPCNFGQCFPGLECVLGICTVGDGEPDDGDAVDSDSLTHEDADTAVAEDVPDSDLPPEPDGGGPDAAGTGCEIDDDCASVENPNAPCTIVVCNTDTGLCEEELASDNPTCDDGDACTSEDSCLDGVCVGTSVDCDDELPCTADSCDLDTGECSHDVISGCGALVPPCLPGISEDCETGVCEPNLNACVACATAADCGEGTFVCLDYQCIPGLACSSDLDCKDTGQVCNKDAGVCADCLTEADCEDEQLCVNDTCVDAAPCDSSKDCPQVCDQAAGHCVECLESVDCAGGHYCTADHRCAPGLCIGVGCASGYAVPCKEDGSGYVTDGVGECNDGEVCTQDACETGQGCVYAPIDADCDDGDACTDADTCLDGSCAGQATLDCDDDELCTDDSCEASAGCVHTPNTDGCDDGDDCTDVDACLDGVCVGAGSVAGCCEADADCDDGNPCTQNACEPQGCTAIDVAGDCDDGNACTEADTCSGGVCGGTTKSCDDGEACTADSCDESTGCIHDPSDGDCEDGEPCTVGDLCVDKVCVPGAMDTCDDDNPCTDDGCEPGVGCTNTDNSAECDDGDLCTVGDVCSEGQCQGGTSPDCDDTNNCTVDSCDADTGECLNEPVPNCSATKTPCEAWPEIWVNEATQMPCDEGVCDPVTRACVDCVQDSDCGEEGYLCVNRACQAATVCASDVTCKDDGKVCHKPSKVCVDCNIDADCGDSGDECINHVCVEVTTCNSSNDCPLVCHTGLGRCVDCLTSDDCSAGTYCAMPAPGDGTSPSVLGYQCLPDICTDDACTAGMDVAPYPWFFHAECRADGSGFKSGEEGNEGLSIEEWFDKQTARQCQSESICRKPTCADAEGCGWEPMNLECGDCNPATPNGTCVDGACAFDAPCDDDVACTDNNLLGVTCDPGDTGWTSLGTLAEYCTASDLTNGICPCEGYDAWECLPHEQPDPIEMPVGVSASCLFTPQAGLCTPDEIPCTDTVCDPVDGCLDVPNDANCADDEISCTVDACDAVQGCVYPPDDSLCDDGIDCTTDTCSVGEVGLCMPDYLFEWVAANDDELVNLYLKDEPCQTADDCSGNGIGQKLACINGYCNGVVNACEISNPQGCEDGGCGSGMQCVETGGCLPNTCDCDSGYCSDDCDDSGICVVPIVCTVDGECPAGHRCVAEAGTGGCATPVTEGCLIDLMCVEEGSVSENDPCQICDPAQDAWSWTTAADAYSCDDGLACSATSECQAGACVETSFACEDNDPCTVDACVEDAGAAACTNEITSVPIPACTSSWLPPGVKVQDGCDPLSGACSFSLEDDSEALKNLQKLYRGLDEARRLPPAGYGWWDGLLFGPSFPPGQDIGADEPANNASRCDGPPFVDTDGDGLIDVSYAAAEHQAWAAWQWAVKGATMTGWRPISDACMHFAVDPSRPEAAECDPIAEQQAYVYGYEATNDSTAVDSGPDSMLADFVASAYYQPSCNVPECRQRLSLGPVKDPNFSVSPWTGFDQWVDGFGTVVCDEGCTLLPPEGLTYRFATGCDEAAEILEGTIGLTPEQRSGFESTGTTETINPFMDEVSTAMQQLMAGAIAYYENSTPGACTFPSTDDTQHGWTPIMPPHPTKPDWYSDDTVEGGYNTVPENMAACCIMDTDGDYLCDASPEQWDVYPWNLLGFAPQEKHHFVYSYAGGEWGFAVQAWGDQFCDGKYSRFVFQIEPPPTAEGSCEPAAPYAWPSSPPWEIEAAAH